MVDEGVDQVAIVIGFHTLHDGGDPFQTHAGIDVGRRQGVVVAVFVLVKLGEDQVPDLQVAVAVATGLAVGPAATLVGAQIDVDFGTGTAGSDADLPEIVLFAQAHNALRRQANFLVPNIPGLLVLFIHRDPQPVGIQFQLLQQEFPGPGNGLFFKVIPEGELPSISKRCGGGRSCPPRLCRRCARTSGSWPCAGWAGSWPR